MKIISLTGGIGSGKSAAADILRDLGAAVVDADQVARAVVLPDAPAWRDIVATFGKEVLLPDRTIDRKALAAKVFSDPGALEELNRITHPRVNQAIRAAFNEHRRLGTEILVVEVQIISGADWVGLTDEVWEVEAPVEVRLQRLEQRGMARAEALRRMAAQNPVDSRVYPRVVRIDNSGSRSELREQLEKLWRALHNE
jgi:dephospho-CoA kinase